MMEEVKLEIPRWEEIRGEEGRGNTANHVIKFMFEGLIGFKGHFIGQLRCFFCVFLSRIAGIADF